VGSCNKTTPFQERAYFSTKSVLTPLTAICSPTQKINYGYHASTVEDMPGRAIIYGKRGDVYAKCALSSHPIPYIAGRLWG
jgi:hypothetical protein